MWNISVVRNAKRLQQAETDRYPGPAHAETHQVFTSSQGGPEENRRYQCQEGPGRNGK